MKYKKQFIFILTFLMIIGISLYFQDFLTIESIKSNKLLIQNFVSDNYLFSVFLFFVFCLIFINSPIPLAAFIKTLGGYIFGLKLGFLINVVSTTLACTVSFYLSRYLLFDYFSKKYSKKFAVLNKEIEENGFFYVLILRITLVFPYFLINILSGISKIKPVKYIISTFLGVIVPSFIYAYFGQNLENVDKIQDLFTVDIFIAIGFIVLLVLFSLVFKKKWIKNNIYKYRNP